MTERDIMRLFEKYDGEVSMSDFTPDELAELIAADGEEDLPVSFKEKYFSKYDDVKVNNSKKIIQTGLVKQWKIPKRQKTPLSAKTDFRA